MKFDRSNKFDLCYYGQVSSLRLKSSVASKWASNHLLGNIYFAGDGTILAVSHFPLGRNGLVIYAKLYIQWPSLLRVEPVLRNEYLNNVFKVEFLPCTYI